MIELDKVAAHFGEDVAIGYGLSLLNVLSVYQDGYRLVTDGDAGDVGPFAEAEGFELPGYELRKRLIEAKATPAQQVVLLGGYLQFIAAGISLSPGAYLDQVLRPPEPAPEPVLELSATFEVGRAAVQAGLTRVQAMRDAGELVPHDQVGPFCVDLPLGGHEYVLRLDLRLAPRGPYLDVYVTDGDQRIVYLELPPIEGDIRTLIYRTYAGSFQDGARKVKFAVVVNPDPLPTPPWEPLQGAGAEGQSDVAEAVHAGAGDGPPA